MSIFHQLLELLNKEQGFILATIVKAEGSAIEYLGEKILFDLDHNIIINQLEDSIAAFVKKQVKNLSIDKAKAFTFTLSKGEDTIEIFLEKNIPAPKAVVFGAGHISQPTCKLLKMIGFHVTVIDDRIDFANKSRFPDADTIIVDSFENAVQKITVDNNTWLFFLTRGHRYDYLCLEKLIDKNAAFFGMMGSKSRAAITRKQLKDAGFSQETIEKLHSPIGLDIGGQTPEELAISIVSQVISLKSKRIDSHFSKEILDAIVDNPDNIAGAMVTIIKRAGSAPRDVGTRMFVFADGRIVGTIGGGCVEAEVRQKALEIIDSGKPIIYTVSLTADQIEDEGMVCGGKLEVFIEKMPPLHR